MNVSHLGIDKRNSFSSVQSRTGCMKVCPWACEAYCLLPNTHSRQSSLSLLQYYITRRLKYAPDTPHPIWILWGISKLLVSHWRAESRLTRNLCLIPNQCSDLVFSYDCVVRRYLYACSCITCLNKTSVTKRISMIAHSLEPNGVHTTH